MVEVLRRVNGAPDRNRTCDLQFRKLTLYPTELQAQNMSGCYLENSIGELDYTCN